MVLWKNINEFYTKKKYDFETPEITLYSFHPQLYLIFIINGIFFKNKLSYFRFVWPVLNTTLALVAIAFELMLIYQGLSLNDYASASEAFCYVIILGTTPIVCVSILYNREIIIEQLNKMNDDLVYISGLGPRYRDPFMKGQLQIWKLCCVWFGFCGFTCSMYVVNTFTILLYQSLISKQDENTIRPLIFPLWLPEDDPYRTPNYEVFMFFEIYIISIIFQNFCGYVYMQFHILLHYYNLMDMIILDLECVFDGLDASVVNLPSDNTRKEEVQSVLNKRMKRIVGWHTAVFDCVGTVSSVYGPPLVYQVMLSSVSICVTAYQVADKLEHGKLDFLFAVLWLAVCMQLWIPCYLGTLIRDKAFSIGDACWNCGWHKTSLGRMLRLHIMILIHRAQQPLTIQFTGLPSLTLETYSSIMTTSYSYFNMLRQSTK